MRRRERWGAGRWWSSREEGVCAYCGKSGGSRRRYVEEVRRGGTVEVGLVVELAAEEGEVGQVADLEVATVAEKVAEGREAVREVAVMEAVVRAVVMAEAVMVAAGSSRSSDEWRK